MSAGSAGGGLPERLAADLAALDTELAEIDLLITQATAEAERHEQKRAAATDKLQGSRNIGEPPAGLVEQAVALVTLTRRAGVMEAQVDVLTGKRKVLARYREAMAQYLGLPPDEGAAGDPAGGVGLPALPSGAAPGGPKGGRGRGTTDRASARVALAAQEELRREIARAMHDGPAQSLTNIVLQAQIVERIAARDPVAAREEVRQLIAMVQRTLDATKAFISDVRPMVLDDLGLVPTLRGAARDRGRRAGITVGFESFGTDRRLPTDIESALFRLFDDSLAAYLALRPEQVQLRLDWSEQLEARVTAARIGGDGRVPVAANAVLTGGATDENLPPALAAMIAQRRDDEAAAAETARLAHIATLPDATWQAVQFRAAGLGIEVSLEDGGGTLVVIADLAALSGH
jgi:signal transduction histidine kinase